MAAKVYGSELRTIMLGNMAVRYELTRKSVKNVNLRIDAAGNVKVSASRRVPVNYIEGFMRQKQDFIIAAVGQAEENRLRRERQESQVPMQYADGEWLNLLGTRREIRVIQSNTERVTIDEGHLYIMVKNPDNTRHKELLYEKWLRSYRQEVYEDICRQVHGIFSQRGVEYPEVKIRRMTSRWGSCQPYKGIITLNSRLIETPPSCIEYVVMHEFSHFIHPDHSKAFHALMTGLMPDWKQRRKLLDAITEWNG